jgi:uncharacterized protein
MLYKQIDFEMTELKAESEGIFSGYVSKFNNLDLVRDVVVPGAFTEDLESWKKKGRLPNMWFNHDRDKIAGKWIEMYENKNGLFGKGKLSLGSTIGKDVYEWMKDGALDGLSFAYRVKDYERDKDKDVTYLKKLTISEAGPVSAPANPLARVGSVKNMIDSGELEKRQLEQILRDELGLSKKQAMALLSKGWEGLADEEAENDDLGNLKDFIIRDLRQTLRDAV